MTSIWSLPPEPIRQWNWFERGLMHRGGDLLRVAPDATDVDPVFLPESDATSFELGAYWIDERFVRVYSADPVASILECSFFMTRGERRYVLFLVHPFSKHLYAEFLASSNARPAFSPGEGLWASPTSSTRTVFVWGAQWQRRPFFAKLSVDGYIGDARRTLTAETLTRSIGVTSIIDAVRHELPANFKILRDAVAFVPCGANGLGFLVRPVPDEVVRQEVDFVPVFSLLSRRKDGGTWLAQLINVSEMSAYDFISENLLRPFARQWTRLVVEEGFIPEPHAQNLLVEMTRTGDLTGTFVHRDMEAFYVDLRHRSKAHKYVPTTLPTVSSLHKNYKQYRMLVRAFKSVYLYFQGTILYEIDRLFHEHRHDAMWSIPSCRSASMERVFMRELELALEEYTGRTVCLRDGSYSEDLRRALQSARSRFYR